VNRNLRLTELHTGLLFCRRLCHRWPPA